MAADPALGAAVQYSTVDYCIVLCTSIVQYCGGGRCCCLLVASTVQLYTSEYNYHLPFTYALTPSFFFMNCARNEPSL